MPVRVKSVSVAHPSHWVTQEEAAQRIGEASGESRRVAALARGTKIKRRAIAMEPDLLACLGSIEERNDVYQQVAPQIALEAARLALGSGSTTGIEFLATSSCTGYMVPGLDVALAKSLGLAATTSRLPITEAGCAGGVVAMARLADFLRIHPSAIGLALAVEICSLAFHSHSETGNLTSALIFGDGAGAALLESDSGNGRGLEIVDSLSFLIPDSQEALGFALTDRGFYPVLTRELADLLPGPTLKAAGKLLDRYGLDLQDLAYWLIHPGGARILESLQQTLSLSRNDLRWSWESLADFGNTSSAAIFDVIRRYSEDSDAPQGWGLVVAFGPGVSIEMLLVRR